MGESDKNRKKVKNRTFQTKYHYGLIVIHVLHAVVVYVSIYISVTKPQGL